MYTHTCINVCTYIHTYTYTAEFMCWRDGAASACHLWHCTVDSIHMQKGLVVLFQAVSRATCISRVLDLQRRAHSRAFLLRGIMYTCVSVCVCSCVCVCVCVCVCLCACVYVFVWVCLVWVHVRLRMRVSVCVWMCMHAFIYINFWNASMPYCLCHHIPTTSPILSPSPSHTCPYPSRLWLAPGSMWKVHHTTSVVWIGGHGARQAKRM